MPDPKRKKVKMKVCGKTDKNGKRSCKYVMRKRTAKELKQYDAMKSADKDRKSLTQLQKEGKINF
tara:strand:- start:1540 stop:1734 length:195 start_codon:yes stop_codon:yes gene_type:complete